jgi:hypothetical protein
MFQQPTLSGAQRLRGSNEGVKPHQFWLWPICAP